MIFVFGFWGYFLLGCFSNRFVVDFGLILDSFWGGFGTSKALKIDVGLGLKTGTRQSRPGILDTAETNQNRDPDPPPKGHFSVLKPGNQGSRDWKTGCRGFDTPVGRWPGEFYFILLYLI